MRLRTFSHGVHPAEAKITSDAKIRRFPFANELTVLLSQHIGRPAKAIVFKGQEVVRGERIAEADGRMSIPLFAPATGVVSEVGETINADGVMTPSITIKPFPASEQIVHHKKALDVDKLTPDELVSAIQNIGMVGLGGAAFTAHVKFSPPKDKTIETFIVNGCECEPYLTADHRVMLEHPEDVISGIKIILKITGADRAIIATESNKQDAADLLAEAAKDDERISVEVLKTKYPQGAEKLLTRALLGKDIPSGGLPADIGVVVSNVTTVAEIGALLPMGCGIIERVITISGQGVSKPGNFRVPIGTPLEFVLEKAGLNDQARQVIFGGPMMGKSVSYLGTPITEGVTSIVVLSESELAAGTGKIHACIQCAECVSSCPIHLNPSKLGRLARKSRFDEMVEEYNLFDCFECGSCSYVCPSHIPLVQMFRIAKKVVRSKASG